jgi:hypothetical protein
MEDYRANASDVAQDNADASAKIACPVMSLWGRDFNLTRAILCCKNEQKMRESQSRCEKTEGGDDSAVSPAG